MILLLFILLWLLAALSIYLSNGRGTATMRIFTVVCTSGLMLFYAVIVNYQIAFVPMSVTVTNSFSKTVTPYFLVRSSLGNDPWIIKGKRLRPGDTTSRILEVDGMREVWLVAVDDHGQQSDFESVKVVETKAVAYVIHGTPLNAVPRKHTEACIRRFHFRHMFNTTLVIINTGLILLLITGAGFLKYIFLKYIQ